jgi:hypothetical protein
VASLVRRSEPDRLAHVRLSIRPNGRGVVVAVNHLAGSFGRQKQVAGTAPMRRRRSS